MSRPDAMPPLSYIPAPAKDELPLVTWRGGLSRWTDAELDAAITEAAVDERVTRCSRCYQYTDSYIHRIRRCPSVELTP